MLFRVSVSDTRKLIELPTINYALQGISNIGFGSRLRKSEIICYDSIRGHLS